MISLTRESIAIGSMRRVSDSVIEEYCALVHRINSGQDSSSGRSTTIGVTGCTARAGTSTVALNLAVAAARLDDRPVLLVDLSAHGDALTTFGMSSDLEPRATFAPNARRGTLVKASDVPNLFVLVVENDGNAKGATLDRREFNDLVHSLEPDFGWIVVDLPTTDTSLCFSVAGLFDGILLTMDAECTRRNVAAKAQQRLDLAQANLLGVILNKHRQYIPNWLDARL